METFTEKIKLKALDMVPETKGTKMSKIRAFSAQDTLGQVT